MAGGRDLCSCIAAIAIGMGFRKLQRRAMPVAASCSFAIAAASHRPVGDVDAAVLPVRWGEVTEMEAPMSDTAALLVRMSWVWSWR